MVTKPMANKALIFCCTSIFFNEVTKHVIQVKHTRANGQAID